MEQLDLYVTTLCVLIFFLASFVRGAFGFGDSLICMPCLLMIMPLSEATVLSGFLSLIIGLTMSKKNFSEITKNRSECLRILIGSLFGIPLGATLLLMENLQKPLLITFACYLVVSPFLSSWIGRAFCFKSERYASIAGFIGGSVGGFLSTFGPPLVIYGRLRHWTPSQFTSVLQPYFVLGNIIGIITYAVLGLIGFKILQVTLISLPIIWIAIALGQRTNQMLSAQRFGHYANALLIFTGFFILYQSLA